MLPYTFTYVEPVRSRLLQMLPPFEIAKLLQATQCNLSDWEKQRYMDVLDDVFQDTNDLSIMRELGMTVRIFGSDLELLEKRLQDPVAYLKEFEACRAFHIFVLVTDKSQDPDSTSKLVRDFRHLLDQNFIPGDMSKTELSKSFSLSGSLSAAAPGWIPLFNARERINVRAYISTFSDCNNRILHMNRVLMRQVFGYRDNREFLSNLQRLITKCYVLEGGRKRSKQLHGKLTINSLQDIFAAAFSRRETAQDHFVVVNAVHPLNSSIALALV